MSYVAIPVAMLVLGKPIPVDVLAPDGRLLLRRGQTVESQQQIDLLSEHQACMSQSDAVAWEKSYERMIRTMLRDGVPIERILQTGMPSEIGQSDYQSATEVKGSWLDLQETLRGLLYQGVAAISPLQRLDGIETRVRELLAQDADEALFILVQALTDTALGYCATHALLSAVTVDLTAEKLGLVQEVRGVLLRSALVMNIGMAREQDSLAQQKSPLSAQQKELVRERSRKSFQILQQIGITDEDELDLVRWQHDGASDDGLVRNRLQRQLLRMVNQFVAKLAPRKTRKAMTALGAQRSVFVGADAEATKLGSALAMALGFYPPGSYVLLANAEQAVVLARGERANAPQVLSIVNPAGMVLGKPVWHDSSVPQFAVRAAVNPDKIKVRLNLEKVRKVRREHAG